MQFLSTLPARGATRPSYATAQSAAAISIHAPREGSDVQDIPGRIDVSYFYPRSPRGERRFTPHFGNCLILFLSTLPARGATCNPDSSNHWFYISIHAPREGSDVRDDNRHIARLISIHAPLAGSDGKIQQKCGWILRKRSKGRPGGVQNRGAVLCIRYNFSTDGRRPQAFRRCEPCGRGVCAGASHRGACAGRVPGAEALGYTSKTSSWDHCGARPMCSTLVL